MEDYPPSSLVKIKQKYYVSVTVPQRLEPFFKTKQIRRSTGTADQSAARKKQHDKTRDIYQQFIDVEAMAVVSKQDAAIAKAQQFVDELGLRADIKDLAANNPKKMTFVMGILDSLSHEFSKPMPGEPQLKPVDYLAKDMEAMSEPAFPK